MSVMRRAVEFLFFGEAQKIMKCGELHVPDFDCIDYTGLRLKLTILHIFPELQCIGEVMDIAVNGEYANLDKPIIVKCGDKISVLPHINAKEETDFFPDDHEDTVVKFLFFGAAGTFMQSSAHAYLFPGGEYTGLGLKLQVLSKFKALEPIKNNMVIAVNREYIAENEIVVVKRNDVIAVIPPLSGG